MQRARATQVIRATARLKILADQARRRLEEQSAKLSNDEEAGLAPEEDGPAFDGKEAPITTKAPSTCSSSLVSSSHMHPLLERQLVDPWYTKDGMALKGFLFSSWLNLLLIACPLAVVCYFKALGVIPAFVLSFVGLIPLAMLLGDVTEDLAVRYGDVTGGLLNATFGNVVELILSLAALKRRLYDVVSSSLLGSILSNLLLVLGCCFFVGGLRWRTQHFNALANKATSSLLFLSCIGIIVPTSADHLVGNGEGAWWILDVSRGTAIVLIIMYVCYLVFQLKTHHDIFQPDDEDEPDPVMTLPGALLSLTCITGVVALLSEILTGTIEEFSKSTGIGKAFLGLIILPIAGNACEHITAVIVAYKNKIDLALGVAVGSSIQIALFVIPLTVIVGWITDRSFSLDFDPFATLALTLSVIHANFVTADSTSHWLQGLQLIATYILIAITFLFR